MKLYEAAQLAIKNKNAKEVGRISDLLRLRAGANYNDVVGFFVKHTGVDPGELEEMFYEADSGGEG